MKLQQVYQQNNTNQQTRRSMIPYTDNPAPSNLDTNIDDILALQLSDTLINAAYQLSAVKINLAIQKICVLQNLLIEKMAWGFESILERGNTKYQKEQFSKQTSINIYKQQNKDGEMIVEKKNLPILLTVQQQEEKLYIEVKQKILNFVKILKKKTQSQKYYAICLLKNNQCFKKSSPVQRKVNVLVKKSHKLQQLTRTEHKPHTFIRRSIDKLQYSNKGINQQISLSLNKNYQYSSYLSNRTNNINLNSSTINNNKPINSPRNNINLNNSPMNSKFSPIRLSKNILSSPPQNIEKINKNNSKTATKQSTCSQSSAQQENYHNYNIDINKNNQIYRDQHNMNITSQIVNSSKQTFKGTINYNIKNKDTDISIDSSFNRTLTKQKQLELLRKKYNKLVDQFKHFSQRFLSVIKEQ